MKINYNCLPCLINQVVKVADMTKAKNKDELFRQVFGVLSTLDFNKTNPQIIGETFELLKKHIGEEDPYLEIRSYYNKMFLSLSDTFRARIERDENPFQMAVKYAILGNIIDFNPIHNSEISDILSHFEHVADCPLVLNDTAKLKAAAGAAKTLLYLGDNCGEICLDKLLLAKIKEQNPKLTIYFGVRGTPVVNDSIEADAYQVGIDEYATILSNGDKSLGTVLSHTSAEFQEVFWNADLIIAKGQANYESLSEEKKEDMYFLLMAKCAVIADAIGVPQKSMICKRQEF